MTSVNENSGLLGHVKDHSSVADAESDLEEAVGKAFPPSEPFLSRLSPLFILVFLVLCQLVNYFDRGAVSALVKPLGEYFELSKFEQGVIGGSFMLGYMVFAPLAGVLSQYIRGTRIMAAGLVLWIAAAAVASISWHFYPLIATRIILGFGEAAFASIAPSIIDDISVPRNRSLWLSIYFMAIPVGQSIGFIAAGSISTSYSWKLVFVLEAILMLPFPIICFFLPSISVIVENGIRKLSHTDRAAKKQEKLETDLIALTAAKRTFGANLKLLITNPEYVLAVLGYACLTFTIGGLIFWAGEYYTESLNLPLDRVSLIFGAVSVIAGLFGAVGGGLIMDRIGGTNSKFGIVKAFAMCSIVIVPSIAVGGAGVLTFFPPLAFTCAGGAVLLFSVALAPINGVILRVVPHDLRAFAVSLMLFTIHLLGDFPSPVVVGWIADSLISESCDAFCGLRNAMLILMCYVILAVVFWTFGMLVAYSRACDSDKNAHNTSGIESSRIEEIKYEAEEERTTMDI